MKYIFLFRNEQLSLQWDLYTEVGRRRLFVNPVSGMFFLPIWHKLHFKRVLVQLLSLQHLEDI